MTRLTLLHLTRLILLLAIVASWMAAPSTVDAQRPRSAQPPPDIVRLRDGGMMRGTISEHVPGSHVTIVLPTGEVRRVEAAEVQWAGPAAEAPPDGMSVVAEPPSYGGDTATTSPPLVPGVYPAPLGMAPGMPVAAPPGTPVATSAVPVHFESDRESVRVDLRVGTTQQLVVGGNRYGVYSSIVERPVFQQLCMAPCTQEITTGRFQIGVALGDNARAYLIPQPIDLRSPTRVQIHWGDRYAIRVIASIVWALVGAGATAAAVVGAYWTITPFHYNEPAAELLVSGAIGVGVSTAACLPFVMLKDEISFQLGPL